MSKSNPVFDKLCMQLPELRGNTLCVDSDNCEIIKGNAFVNIRPVNKIRRINKFHECVNKNMDFDKVYISCVETLEQRSSRLKNSNLLKSLNFLICINDFLFHRILHKVPLINKMYFFVTLGKSRPVSRAEALGRIVSCGFEIQDEFEIDGLLYIVSKKKSLPAYDMSASFSLIFAMRRVGYKGRVISVYKMRTMHPFSEYLQSYIMQTNKLHKKGKINNDYRVTSWGKFIRRYWIDELPMIINFLKGELNIVGVRPLSQDFFNRYPVHLQKLRVKVKPGLIPPYYADMPNSLDEVFDSEKRYIHSKLKNPFRTDWIYFWKAMNNIFIKGARSK
jgi:hypothetical protein